MHLRLVGVVPPALREIPEIPVLRLLRSELIYPVVQAVPVEVQVITEVLAVAVVMET